MQLTVLKLQRYKNSDIIFNMMKEVTLRKKKKKKMKKKKTFI